MTRELWERIAQAFYAGAATVTEQDFLNTAAASPNVQNFDELPVAAQHLLTELEQRGRSRPAV